VFPTADGGASFGAPAFFAPVVPSEAESAASPFDVVVEVHGGIEPPLASAQPESSTAGSPESKVPPVAGTSNSIRSTTAYHSTL
jgi:hypothetical protein